MGISLYGLTPATTYDALIKTGDNEPLTASLKVLSDGVGTNLPMEASTTGINFTGALQQSGVAVPTASQVAAKQDTLVSGTNIKTVNSTSLLGSGNVAVQDVLVSGTNIKTINGTSVLGSGNIVTPSTSPSGVSGAIQFSNGSAFASDAANFFWDNTNKRLGIGTNAPIYPLDILSGGTYVAQFSNSVGKLGLGYDANGGFLIPLTALKGTYLYNNSGNTFIGVSGAGGVGVNTLTPSGAFHIKGSGSTSATTSLLVQNSAGVDRFKIQDDGTTTLTVSKSTLSNSIIGPEARIAIVPYSASIGTLFNSVSTNGGTNYPVTFWATDFFAEITGGLQIATSAVSVNASAKLQVDSTTRGFLPPRMTSTQKTNIVTPAAGLVVYDSTTNKLCCYNGSTWNDLF